MDRKLVGAMLLLFASSGCRMCSSCCDNLPPVLDGPYSSQTGGRAGSAFGAVIQQQSYEEEITVSASEEEPTAALEKQVLFAQPTELVRLPDLHFVRNDD